MTQSKDTLRAAVNKLTKQLADAEAVVSGIKIKLAQAEAKLTGQQAPLCGLDELWKIALPISRNRSSKHLCRKAWNLIPKGERPTIETMLNALKKWNRCAEWRKDGNQFAIALDRWIKERRWEDLPEESTSNSGGRCYTTPAKPLPKVDPADVITDPAEIAKFLSIRAPRINS